mgnify:FL=1|jgi:hypothetical protein|tara:strand:- start:1143 stop:1433 length:291 start_codon:yes stop_codon:yes gene_type:complete
MTEITDLKRLRDNIEKMERIHQIHIFKILKENQIEFTENSNGVFVNMTLLDDTTLKQINNFIKYVNLQQKQLESIEDIKAQYQKEFYKDNKETTFA